MSAARIPDGTPLPGPLLGLATTRQLLDELRARGDCEHQYMAEGAALAITVRGLLMWLPPMMLAYRTVGSE